MSIRSQSSQSTSARWIGSGSIWIGSELSLEMGNKVITWQSHSLIEAHVCIRCQADLECTRNEHIVVCTAKTAIYMYNLCGQRPPGLYMYDQNSMHG